MLKNKTRLPAGLLILTLLTLLAACRRSEPAQPDSGNVLTLQSTGVTNGILSTRYTCDGQSIAPPLSWSGAPASTKSYAITMHHIPPTGEKHVYYILYNLPASVVMLPENNTTTGTFGINTVNGRNSYSPPCSQGPGPKTYVLTVYALSVPSVTMPATTKVTMDVLLDAINPSVVGKAELPVVYSR
ncbi:YbhB/YbcL family Raf kinase inhibitor-like protein [Arsenicibacter rosenii]|uniref:Phosphatidylethanolamine-binding protein n=1 Tax=Arsenicibacter rosenii TaxID=1750698 RepID=A0A1S2VPJ8_9BACT|nr:YbhB/YbcL family Raf kinase inhibitor-like protein [Arsenicibacter rosenii]OIN60691.1 hypothetical protein BLX24_00830 [Arsenicibacter rosenii]